MGVGDDPKSFDEVLVDLRKRMRGVETRKLPDYPDFPSKVYTPALLDPAYRGPGPARVMFMDGSGLSADAYQWIGKYEPWGNRAVVMTQQQGAWKILGQTNEEGLGGKIALPLGSNARSYNYLTANNVFTEPRVQRLSSGIVVLSGLVGFVASVYGGGTNNVIATLPVGYRPDTNLLIGVNATDQAKTIHIEAATGLITVYGTTWPTSGANYVALDGIAFPAAGVATWTLVGSAGSGSAFANGWTGSSGATGAPAYWKDPYGVVWWRGYVSGGSTAADDTAMITMPASHASHLQSHVLTASTDLFGYVSAHPSSASGKIAWKTGSTANTWVSLANLRVATPDTVGMWTPLRTTNSWARYSTAFPAPEVWRRRDGLVLTQGLLGAGTSGAKYAQLTDEFLPDKRAIVAAVSGAAFARTDIAGLREIELATSGYPGSMWQKIGTNAWQAIDGLTWMVGD